MTWQLCSSTGCITTTTSIPLLLLLLYCILNSSTTEIQQRVQSWRIHTSAVITNCVAVVLVVDVAASYICNNTQTSSEIHYIVQYTLMYIYVVFVIIKVLLSITRFSWPKRIVYTLDDNSQTSCVHITTHSGQFCLFLFCFFEDGERESFLASFYRGIMAKIWDYFWLFRPFGLGGLGLQHQFFCDNNSL